MSVQEYCRARGETCLSFFFLAPSPFSSSTIWLRHRLKEKEQKFICIAVEIQSSLDFCWIAVSGRHWNNGSHAEVTVTWAVWTLLQLVLVDSCQEVILATPLDFTSLTDHLAHGKHTFLFCQDVRQQVWSSSPLYFCFCQKLLQLDPSLWSSSSRKQAAFLLLTYASKALGMGVPELPGRIIPVHLCDKFLAPILVGTHSF